MFLSSITLIARAQAGVEIFDTIFSEILNENRALDISLPMEYEPGSTERYEVIYILDGEWNTTLFSSIYSFAMEEEFVPPVILVSIPNTYIDDNYSTKSVNSLYGHSYGGLFSMYTLLCEPDVFDNYYCTDPPLGWENGYLKKVAGELFAEDPKLAKKLWIAGTSHNSSIDEMSKFLEKNAPKKLTWQTATYPKENHNSVRLKGIYDGIKFCYK